MIHREGKPEPIFRENSKQDKFLKSIDEISSSVIPDLWWRSPWESLL